MKRLKRLLLLAIVVALLLGIRWMLDGTIRDQKLIDHLVRQVTWLFPDSQPATIQRLHAWQSGKWLPKRCEYLYLEVARPRDMEHFLEQLTAKLIDLDTRNDATKKPSWSIRRGGKFATVLDDYAPGWWPPKGYADVIVQTHYGARLLAPRGSDHMYIFLFVPD